MAYIVTHACYNDAQNPQSYVIIENNKRNFAINAIQFSFQHINLLVKGAKTNNEMKKKIMEKVKESIITK